MERKANALDLIKSIACILIVGSHCLPIFNKTTLNYYYGQWFFRFCVPLFFLSTGYYYCKMRAEKQRTYITRISVLYAISSVVYLPAYILDGGIKQIVSKLVFGYYHLWYMSALAIGLLVLHFASKVLKRFKYLLILLLGGGILLGLYYRLFDSSLLERLAKVVSVFGGARHALFFAVPMLLIGWAIADFSIDKKVQGKPKLLFASYVFLMFASFVEATILRSKLGDSVRLDVTIFGWMPAIPLLLLSLVTLTEIKPELNRKLRKTTDIVYIIHIWVLIAIKTFTSFERIGMFFLVTVASFILAFIIEMIIGKVVNL